MFWNFFQWHSLKTRVTIFTLAIFVISIWLLAFYASHMLREDMQRLLGEQQFSTATYIAEGIDKELKDRMAALELIANEIDSTLLDNLAALQAFLQQRQILQVLFNIGVFVTRLDGIAIADFPVIAGRVGTNYIDREHLSIVLRDGKTRIGKPIMGKAIRVPILPISVSIQDKQGKVIGVMVGATDLSKPSFLDRVTAYNYGKAGGYLLVAPQYRLVVAATDKSRILTNLPAEGKIPEIDRFIQGYEGFQVYVNPFGVEWIAAKKRAPLANLDFLVAVPTEEAFLPIQNMQRRILLVAILLTLAAGVLTWWMIMRQLAPMFATVKTLATLSDTSRPPQPLPITSQDEIGELIGGFNRLLETLRNREEDLVREKVELEATLARVKRLEGMLSICMQCKKIRAENNDWHQLEQYIGEHSDAVFSHGLCPDCLEKAMKKLD